MFRCPSALLSATIALSLALSAGAPSPVFAQPSSAAIAGAQVLVGEGRKQRAAGNLKGARDCFESAYILVRTPIIGLDLGRVRESLGYLVEARAVLLESSALPPIANESDESKEARAESKRLAAELDTRIPTLLVQVAGIDAGTKIVVFIDERAVDDASKPYALNPGKHTVVVRAGDREQRAEVELAEKDAHTEAISFPVIEKPPPPPPPAPIEKPAPPPKPVPIPTLTYVGFSTAAAGLIIGTVTGIVALRKAHDFATSCEGYNFKCPPALRDNYDTARLYGNVSTIAFIASGVGLGVGVIGLLTRDSSPKTEASLPRRAWDVSVGVGQASALWRF